jgi:Sulfotransferase domain
VAGARGGLPETFSWDNAANVSQRNKSTARMPDFIAVGPGRTGTTWLDAVLRGHVGLPLRVKETEFFTKYYAQGIDWYARLFRHCQADKPAGEVCPYFGSEEARDRISRHIPGCRIICTLRDPVDWAYSMYRTLRYAARIRNVSFEEAIAKYSLIMRGDRYVANLSAWMSAFGEHRVLVCFYDDLRSDRQGFLDRVCDFIAIPRISLDGVDISPRDQNSSTRAPRNLHLARKARRLIDRLKQRQMYRTINALDRVRLWDFCFGRGEKFPPLDPAIERRLRDHFLPEIEALEAMLGRDLSAWKRPLAAREEERHDSRARGLAGA